MVGLRGSHSPSPEGPCVKIYSVLQRKINHVSAAFKNPPSFVKNNEFTLGPACFCEYNSLPLITRRCIQQVLKRGKKPI